MRKLFVASFLLLALCGHATHIVGGEIYYAALGNDDYQVTLKLYRDCGAGNTNNTALDFSATIGVFNSSGSYYSSSTFYLPSELNVPLDLNNPCLTAPPGLCIKYGVYSGVIHLPSGAGGYTLSYQRCCRTPTIVNLNDAGNQGLTCTVTVPDPDVNGDNSSPVFNEYPPVALCSGQPMYIDQSATDPDGDVLEYAVCAPFQGADAINPMPVPPSGPPYTAVAWATGYSTANQLNTTPPMTIDAATGMLTVTPALIGSFTVGVSVKEYRDGVLLSTVIRDFRFDVVNCVVDIISSIQEQTSFCEGLTAHMVNASFGSDFYFWDFGVPGTEADTSSEVEPSYTYPGPGTYTVMLVANPGWTCGDTSYSTFEIYDSLNVAFQPPGILCPDQMPLLISAIGNFTPTANVTWDFGDGVSPDSGSPTTTVSFSSLGFHVVNLLVEDNGCFGVYTDSIEVFPLPVPVFHADTNGCVPFEPVFTNDSYAWTPMTYLWDLGDGTTSADSLPEHLYETPGSYDITLTVSTDSGCVTSRSLTHGDLFSVWPSPVAQFTADPMSTTVLFPDIDFHDYSIGAVRWDYLVEGLHDTMPDFSHRFSDAGWYDVLLTVHSIHDCMDTATMRVFIGDHLFYAPTAFSPDGDGHNEVWGPSVMGARQYHLDVFDRWGHLVFSTDNPTKGWDGKNGLPGIYAYKAWLTEWGPLEKEYNGSFVLIR